MTSRKALLLLREESLDCCVCGNKVSLLPSKVKDDVKSLCRSRCIVLSGAKAVTANRRHIGCIILHPLVDDKKKRIQTSIKILFSNAFCILMFSRTLDPFRRLFLLVVAV